MALTIRSLTHLTREVQVKFIPALESTKILVTLNINSTNSMDDNKHIQLSPWVIQENMNWLRLWYFGMFTVRQRSWVFSHVCLSTPMYVTITHDAIGHLTMQRPPSSHKDLMALRPSHPSPKSPSPRHVQICWTWNSLYRTPAMPPSSHVQTCSLYSPEFKRHVKIQFLNKSVITE